MLVLVMVSLFACLCRGCFEIKHFKSFETKPWYFLQGGVCIASKKFSFEYHSLLDTMIFLKYLKLHFNSNFSLQ
jgi:hypothetical protein